MFFAILLRSDDPENAVSTWMKYSVSQNSLSFLFLQSQATREKMCNKDNLQYLGHPLLLKLFVFYNCYVSRTVWAFYASVPFGLSCINICEVGGTWKNISITIQSKSRKHKWNQFQKTNKTNIHLSNVCRLHADDAANMRQFTCLQVKPSQTSVFL